MRELPRDGIINGANNIACNNTVSSDIGCNSGPVIELSPVPSPTYNGQPLESAQPSYSECHITSSDSANAATNIPLKECIFGYNYTKFDYD